MNSILGRIIVAATFLAVTVHAADAALIAAVRAADNERVAATKAADRARLELLYSDDLHYAHSSGKVDNKAEHLAVIAKRNNTYENFDYRTREFLQVGPGVVLMKGRVVIHSSNAKGKHQNDVNYLAVWREEQGKWRLVAWQASKNPPVDPATK